ncbi:MAG: type II secretion system F family protein [Planctomycetota bacterium]|nr:type II secretion system F family protein [Planctomycetota bacterium]
MISPFIIGIAVFIGVTALVGGMALVLRDKPGNKMEDRLDIITGLGGGDPSKAAKNKATLLTQPLDEMPGVFEELLKKIAHINLNRLLSQADASLSTLQFGVICGVMGLVGIVAGLMLGIKLYLLPLLAISMAFFPFVWLLLKRRKRFKAFSLQLSDALEMLSRCLRSGQSLTAGFNIVSTEMSAPLGVEFGRVFEEQNLGIPLDESLDNLVKRMPNMDLKFFCTAIMLQRQTGGDLSEILDKIGTLIRERFQIWGQVQALTGEGRLSGVILLGLPFVLFLTIYYLNPDYVMVLFEDPVGKKLLAGALVMQVLGAIVIKKIVTIKV